jgi:lipoyl-dependent peroxiredoxin subunit D
MNIADIKARLPEYAKDLKLNLGSILSEQGAPGLEPRQVMATALASALACGNHDLVRAIESEASSVLGDADVNAARAAAAIMGMNNIYYRFLHLVEDEEYQKLPAGLRMQVIGKPGVDKKDFELYSLAVSAINGCGMCIVSHERLLRKEGMSRQAIQSAVRVAAVIHAVAAVLGFQPGAHTAAEAA